MASKVFTFTSMISNVSATVGTGERCSRSSITKFDNFLSCFLEATFESSNFERTSWRSCDNCISLPDSTVGVFNPLLRLPGRDSKKILTVMQKYFVARFHLKASEA